ncbi:MAG: sugar ABC transporter permease [Lachnospiraceae bacterium]|nr:sugar ABC transporter permease [Lachnospiraceae bacterium]
MADQKQAEKTTSKGALKRKKTLVAWSFILPNLIGFFVFTFVPIVFSLFLSLCEWSAGNQGVKFVGLENFKYMFTMDRSFRIALKNTLYYTVVTVPLTLFIALGLAMLMNKPIKGKTFFRSVLFFPYVASLVAVAVVWMALFNPERGPVNGLLMSLGVENPPRWAASQVWAMPTIIGLTVWKGMGYYMVVYLAGLQSVPSELYEAAEIDGANGWAKFRNVTWPCLTPTTFFVLMMLVVATFKSYDIMYITTQGGPGEATKVLAYHIFNSAFVSMKFGYASAVAMVLFVIIILLTLFQFRMEKKFTNY